MRMESSAGLVRRRSKFSALPLPMSSISPVETIGSQLGSIMRETLDAKANLGAQQWVDPVHAPFALWSRHGGWPITAVSLGAVAVVQDLTAEENLRQKQELLDRSAFWTDLAASMSHEIRNPLVAIKTFAQLLPERFDDADFRKDFNEIVVQEIDRLDKIITQINDFAHPPELVMKPVDLRGPVQKAVELAKHNLDSTATSLETDLPNDLPKVWGDEGALTEAFAHLVANAAEATSGLHQGAHHARASNRCVMVMRQKAWSSLLRITAVGSPRICEIKFFPLLHDESARDGTRPADREAHRVRSQWQSRHRFQSAGNACQCDFAGGVGKLKACVSKFFAR